MKAEILLTACEQAGIDFFTGVPDSQLKGLCDALYARYGVTGSKHLVAANEGNAIGLCAGHYLATGRPALCYMQNSGLGNAVNPLVSLMDAQVYRLPCLLVIGWRGEPGVHDEPQHIKQGQITLGQLELMDIPSFILSKETSDEEFRQIFEEAMKHLRAGCAAALVIRKGAMTCDEKPAYGNTYLMSREEALRTVIAACAPTDVIVSTTGKLSRELFELREARGEGHERDFLTVGSMGHASMIALGIAQAQPDRRVWCLDGDGAALMHLGALAVLGQRAPKNLIHVVINNASHETVGGMPVCAGEMKISAMAKAAGYLRIAQAGTPDTLAEAARQARAETGLALIEALCSECSRADLGRPTTTPQENRDAFMSFLARSIQDDSIGNLV